MDWVESLATHPWIMLVFLIGFVSGSLTEWGLEHIPDWVERRRERRKLRERERRLGGPQEFRKGSEQPAGPAPRPTAPQPTARPIVGQKPPQAPRGGKHARPRQRSARFFVRMRRQRR